MYSIKKAAELLGKGETTVRRWMKQYGIRVVEVQTDKKRAYIADDDMKVLVNHVAQQMVSSASRTRDYHRHSRDVIMIGESKYYSFAGAASLLGVSECSIKRWIRADDMVVIKRLKTDRERCYIEHDDLVRIAELHRRNLSPKALADVNIQREGSATETDMDKLCTIKEVALYLDISNSVARTWIRDANIEIKTKLVGRDIKCITYRDVVHLADIHKCEILPALPTMSIREEIKEIRDELRMVWSEIEDIKHDLRLIVKRSIFVGSVRK